MLTLTADPAAIDMGVVSGTGQTGYDSSESDLGVSLNAAAGMLDKYVYAAATTAGSTTAGNVAGYLESERLYNGTADTTGVPVDSHQYYAVTGDVSTGTGSISATIYPQASDTVYRNDDGSGAIETDYGYHWYSGTLQPSVETTYLPIVSTAENGPGTQWTTKEAFDTYGNESWQEDADGSLTYAQRGMAYGKKGDFGNAIADLTETICIDPRDSRAHCNLGTAYGKQGDHDSAISSFTEAIRLDPNDGFAYYSRGCSFEANGDLYSAIADLTEAIGLDPEDAGAYYRRGIVYTKLLEQSKAHADFAQSKKLGLTAHHEGYTIQI